MQNGVEFIKVGCIGGPGIVVIRQINIRILIACKTIAVCRIMTEIRKTTGGFIVITNALTGANPNATLLIARETKDAIEDQRIFFSGYLMKTAYAVSIKAVETITGSKPYKAIGACAMLFTWLLDNPSFSAR